METNDRLALVCIDEPLLQTSVIEQIVKLGYTVHTALFAEEVAVKLRARAYELIAIAETFAGASAETNSALTEVANLALEQRRKVFVILIGPAMVSRSEMQSFMFSVDLTLKADDVPSLQAVVEREMNLKTENYAAFNEAVRVRN